MVRGLLLVLFFTIFSHCLNIDNNTSFTSVLNNSQIYIDYNNTSINQIVKKKFFTIKQNHIGYGYAPKFNVWIKFDLHNTSNKTTEKIIEFNNPLIESIELYNGSNLKLIQKEGFCNISNKTIINPVFNIKLKPYEKKEFYLKVTPSITTLLIALNLWDTKTFYQKELRHSFILALFLGAVGIVILYNFVIFISTKERSYLYYVLAFSGILLHHILYKGLGDIYFFNHNTTIWLIKHATFVVTLPLVFLALFTKNILQLDKFRKLNLLFNKAIVVFVLVVIFICAFNLDKYRGVISVLFMLFLFIVTLYMFMQNNKQAKFLILGYIAFLSSAIFMYLSSAGVFDIFIYLPHYIETSLLVEATAFSLSLANRLKTLQNKLIKQKEKEKEKLRYLVKAKTKELNKSLQEKNELFNELKHRIKNSFLILLGYIKARSKNIDNSEVNSITNDFEKQVFALKKLYDLLDKTGNVNVFDMKEYFESIISQFNYSLNSKKVTVFIDTNLKMNSKNAIYCGLILNEAITNSYKYAFNNTNSGKIFISLAKNDNKIIFIIKDDGCGFDINSNKKSFGINFIKKLAQKQLKGSFDIISNNGTKIKIEWKIKNEK